MDNSRRPPNNGTIESFLTSEFVFVISPLSILVPSQFWPRQQWMCSVCSGLLYNRSSGFISCNKYFNIIAVVTNGFFTDTVCLM